MHQRHIEEAFVIRLLRRMWGLSNPALRHFAIGMFLNITALKQYKNVLFLWFTALVTAAGLTTAAVCFSLFPSLSWRVT